jgi:tRNA U34 5-methylaminomethyl-2-thiouridine-forming methyltransferase MnmC
MSNDEMMKRPFAAVRSKGNLSDFTHSSFFRHSSLGIRHYGAEGTFRSDGSDIICVSAMFFCEHRFLHKREPVPSLVGGGQYHSR